MKSLLLIVDLQKSFVNDKTRKLSIKIEQLIESDKFDLIAFTRFINSEESLWVNKLNFKGCLTEEEKQIVIDTKDYKVFDKSIYTALNKELREYIKENNIDKIYLCGLDTNACVLKTAVDLFENNYNVYVLQDYCMSNNGIKYHKFAIDNLKILIGKDSIL